MSLPWLMRWGYGVGHVLNDLCSAMWFTYALIFLKMVIGLSDVKSGLVVLIGQIADAVATPVVGIWSDRGTLCWLDRMGKRRAWYLVGTILVACTVPFVYSPCLGCENSQEIYQVLYYSIFIILFQFGWAAVQTVHLALASDLTPLESERTFLLSLRNSFTVLCNIFVYVMATVLLEAVEKTSRLSSRDVFKFQIMIGIIVGVGLMTSIFFMFTVKEDHGRPLLETGQSQERASLLSIMKRCLVYLVALIYMTTRLFINMSQTLIPLYLQETLNLEAYLIAVIPLVMYIAGFVTSVMCGFLHRKIGKKVCFLASTISVVGASLWIFLGEGDMYDTYFLYVIALIYGGAGSILLVTALSITSDLIGADIGNSAFVFGIMSFTDKLCSGAAVMIVQSFKPEGQNMYYRDTLAGIAAGSVIIACAGVLCTPRSQSSRDKDIRPTDTSNVAS